MYPIYSLHARPAPDPGPILLIIHRRLESVVNSAVGVLRSVAKRHSRQLGSDFLERELALIERYQTSPEVEQRMQELNELAARSSPVQFLRELRSEFGITWDETHAAGLAWTSMPREKKLKILGLSNCVKHLISAENSRSSGRDSKPL